MAHSLGHEVGDGLNCETSSGAVLNTKWRYFYAQCPKVNVFCNPYGGAYLSAITVCRQFRNQLVDADGDGIADGGIN